MPLTFWVVVLFPLLVAFLASLVVARMQHNRYLVLAYASTSGGVAAICVTGMFILAAYMLFPPPAPGGGNPWGMGMSDAKLAMAVSGVYAFLGTALGLVVAFCVIANRQFVPKH